MINEIKRTPIVTCENYDYDRENCRECLKTAKNYANRDEIKRESLNLKPILLDKKEYESLINKTENQEIMNQLMNQLNDEKDKTK